MEIIMIILKSVASVVVLFVLAKFMGYRQIAEMSLFDYLNGITIGSIAAEMSIADDSDFLAPLIAMIIYALFAVLLSLASSKSIHARHFLCGTPIILMSKGQLYRENLKKAKLDLNEFLTQARNHGFFDLSQLDTVIMEDNGRISYLPKSLYRPTTPEDHNMKPQECSLVANLIIDGKVMPEHLKNIGKDEGWLLSNIKKQGYKNPSDIFLAICDCHGKLTVYPMKTTKLPHDILA